MYSKMASGLAPENSEFGSGDLRVLNPDPKPYTQNPHYYTSTPKPYTRNPKPYT